MLDYHVITITWTHRKPWQWECELVGVARLGPWGSWGWGRALSLPVEAEHVWRVEGSVAFCLCALIQLRLPLKCCMLRREEAVGWRLDLPEDTRGNEDEDKSGNYEWELLEISLCCSLVGTFDVFLSLCSTVWTNATLWCLIIIVNSLYFKYWQTDIDKTTSWFYNCETWIQKPNFLHRSLNPVSLLPEQESGSADISFAALHEKLLYCCSCFESKVQTKLLTGSLRRKSKSVALTECVSCVSSVPRG